MFRVNFCPSSGAQDWGFFTTYGIVSCCCGRQGLVAMQRSTTCTVWSKLLVELILEINKTVIVASRWFLYYHILLTLNILGFRKGKTEICQSEHNDEEQAENKTEFYFVVTKCQLDATDDFYCRSYCLLNMFRAPLCPSSGAREYYTSGCCLSYLVLGFQVVGIVWSWGLYVRFAGCSPQTGHITLKQ